MCERESGRHARRGHDDFNGMCVRERERAGGMSGEVTMISMACVRERERESRRHVRRGHDDFNGVCVREREREACQERSR